MSVNYTPEQKNYKNYGTFEPFKMFVLQNFPFITEDFDALTYYQMLCKVVEYLKDTIENNKMIQENQNEVLKAYNQLQQYVNNYFDNLDVQNEINNKLDSMVTSGQLQGLLNQLYNELEDRVDAKINIIDNKVTNAVSGSPAKVFDTLSDLQTANPDKTRIYVVSENGNWYYWNGTEWANGGTYQASKLGNKVVTIENIDDELIFNNNTRTIDKDKLLSEKEISIDLNRLNLLYEALMGNTGYFNPDISNNGMYVSSKNYLYIPDDYEIVNETTYEDSVKNGMPLIIMMFYYDKNFDFVGSYQHPITQTSIKGMFSKCKDAKYVRFRFNYNVLSEINIDTILSTVKLKITKICNNDKELKLNVLPENLLNPYTTYKDCYIVKDGRLNKDPNYVTSEPIKLKAGETYAIKQARKLGVFSKNIPIDIAGGKQINGYLTLLFEEENVLNYTYTATEECYLVISYPTTMNDNMVVTGNEIPSIYIPYRRQLPDDIDLSNLKNIQELNYKINGIEGLNSNVLFGKKYVSIGDSFTAGDFNNAPEQDYYIESGKYAGKYKVYPYLIGNRNNMEVTNLAENGSKISFIMANDLISKIPSDVDYITVKYGINDAPDHQNTTLGTITDNTTDTFYGAWNVGIKALINNFPNAKIGIIVTNGLSDINYINAIIEIAKKYGIPYLNETTDEKVPLLIRTLRNDVDSEIKELRDSQFMVNKNNGNGHPNAKCHEYESTIVENFLRSL